MKYERAIEAYGVCLDRDGRTLLVQTPDQSWSLPGGAVQHGEHPSDTITRAAAEAGCPVGVIAVRDVLTDIDTSQSRRAAHRDVLVYDVRATETFSGTAIAWLTAAELTDRRLTSATARILGLHSGLTEGGLVKRISWAKIPGSGRNRRQRFAAYGLATDPEGNVLLTQISAGYPGAGRWHLPGGGTDFGETAVAGLARELVEETGQLGVITDLLSVSHRYQRKAQGPEGRPMDWHGVRVVFRVRVDTPTKAVVEDRGGSTVAAAWFTPAQALELPLTEIAEDAIADLRR